MNKSLRELRAVDPANSLDIEKMSAISAFRELFDVIVAEEPNHNIVAITDNGNGEIISEFRPVVRRLEQVRRRRRSLVSAAALVIALAIALPISLVGNGLSAPVTTPYIAARVLPSESPISSSKSNGQWQLVGAVMSASWQQNTSGPPPGALTCPSTTACYALSGDYSIKQATRIQIMFDHAAPTQTVKLVSESLFVSHDFGLSWSVLPMPKGFVATTSLSCGGATDCSAGGELNGQPVFIATTDGGHQWTMSPLAGMSGELRLLDCSTVNDCHGIVGPSWVNLGGDLAFVKAQKAGEFPNEAFVTTTDGGLHWTTVALPGANIVVDLSCADTTTCVALGWDSITTTNYQSGGYFVRSTSNGGATWTTGTLPAGLTVEGNSKLSCSDVEHCAAITDMNIKVTDPPQCKQMTAGAPTPTTVPTATTLPSPSVQVVAGPASALTDATNDYSMAHKGGGFCDPNGRSEVSEIATTSDGGRTWTPDALPSNVPEPALSNIACASATVCWASGSAAIPIKVGGASDGGSAVLLGTTDGGTTWSRVTFKVPQNAPNFDGQSYLDIGQISCPIANACIALGSAAQGSQTTPVYRYIATA